MKVQVKVSKNVIVDAVGDTHKGIFEQIAELQEVFACLDEPCGKCNHTTHRVVVREDSKKRKYYELHCQNPSCRARLSFGQNMQGDSLYPRRKETEKKSVMGGKLDCGDYLPDNGWIKWNSDKGCNE